MTYRISVGSGGSAFGHVGTFDLFDFPAELEMIAHYLRANPDVVDLCVTRSDGSNVVVRREEK